MNILTFDIEEWFHILDNDSTKTEREWSNYEVRIHKNMDKLFLLLEETDTNATFFCLGWIAEKYPEIIKRIDAAGYEIGTHSHYHQLAYNQDRLSYKKDLELSINSIENIIGKKVKSYRAPGFSIKESNKWTFDTLLENGIEIDCSIFPAKRAHGGYANFASNQPCKIQIGNAVIKEFPINTYDIGNYPIIFSGGGYFRFLPLWMTEYMMSKSAYTMAYFHPRDFDAAQPMIKDLSLARKFKSYYGLKTCYDKLKKILLKNKFISLQEADTITNWDKAQLLHL
jgi:peptidoglycan-N-acetylglucosamine deacetylase